MKLKRTKTVTSPNSVTYTAEGELIELKSSQWLEFMTCCPHETIFAQGPPPGKRWDVYINLSVVERDE